ncbi:MAG: LysM domain-containing protein, partial [Chloroflexota bacterium]|nr:LysM domain-containing protein [Chloroflexota bacterium]
MKRTVGIALSLLLLLLLIWLPVVAAQPRSGPVVGTHIVKLGETLYCIGRAYGVDPWAIAAHNAVLDANVIQPGDVLQIPDVPATLPDGPICQRQFEPPSSAAADLPASAECVCAMEHTIVTGET